MPSGSLKLLFVINPGSGPKARLDWETEVRNYFRELPHQIEFYLLTGKNDADSLKYWIDKINPGRVVAVGGDGTVSLVAEVLLGTGIPMGILPAGSANGMAKELEIPNTVKGALDVIMNGVVRLSDVIKINDKDYCLHLSDIGINAQIIKYFEEGNIRGKWGYAIMLIKALWWRRLMHVTIEAENKNHEVEAFMVVIANASKYGTGAVINPDGDLHDGFFEVVIVKKIAISEFLKLFISFSRFNPRKVQVFHTRSVIIETSHKAHFQIDGEYLGKVNYIKARIVPGRLLLLKPAIDS